MDYFSLFLNPESSSTTEEIVEDVNKLLQDIENSPDVFEEDVIISL